MNSKIYCKSPFSFRKFAQAKKEKLPRTHRNFCSCAHQKKNNGYRLWLWVIDLGTWNLKL